MRLAERPPEARPVGEAWATTVPAPDLDAVALFAAARARDLEAALWLQPDRGRAIVGIGRAFAIEAAGPDRFAVAEARWRELLARLAIGGAAGPGAGVSAGGPLLIGGFGFAGRPPSADGPWAPFGPSSVVLPALGWVRTPGGATLTTAAVPSASDGWDVEPDALPGLWRRLVVRAGELSGDDERAAADRGSQARLSVVGGRPDRPAWNRIVGMFAGAVGRGRLDKVVLARRIDVRSDGDLDVPTALRHLAASAPESTLYAFGRGDATFLGATPERLVRTEGRAFETVAIAGSGPRATDPTEDEDFGAALMASEKEREEHAVVVRMLRASLAPIVEELRVAPAPRLLKLRHVQHLMTPVAGTLRDEAGLLALAAILHPTPAVGGEPRDLALELIAQHEGFDRGWYAGPVGWVGADGDGELVIALRCGVVAGPTASLFAGCGIVADSDPAREWEESRIKLRAVGTALGGFPEPEA